MERKRRERINRALTQLKILIIEQIRLQGGTQTAKLDKADILEMTVNYLNLLRNKQSKLIFSNDKFIFNNGNIHSTTDTLNDMSPDKPNTNGTLSSGVKISPIIDYGYGEYSSPLEFTHLTRSSSSSMHQLLHTQNRQTVTNMTKIDIDVSDDKHRQRAQLMYTVPSTLSTCGINRRTNNITAESMFWRPW
ncbi:hypothetical protein ACF0H5_019239 [Mactra antiquata]